jgi:hypothetical protein
MTASVQIGTIRLRSRRDQLGAVARHRLTRPLLCADLFPTGLPPSAIMIVRRLADPLPRQVLARTATAVNPAWERAVRQALSVCYRKAFRPAQGPVPAGAEAVVFSDEAEMLACLLNDAASHDASNFWWWKRIRRPLNSWQPADLAADQSRWIPAAFAYLADRAQITKVLNAITPDDSDRLLNAIAAAFEIALIAPDCRASSNASADLAVSPFDGPPHQPPRVPPWVQDVFSATAAYRLDPQRARLLATALVLHRDPTSMRNPSVQHALADGPASYISAFAPVETRSTQSVEAPRASIISTASTDSPSGPEAFAAPGGAGLAQIPYLTTTHNPGSGASTASHVDTSNHSERSAAPISYQDSPLPVRASVSAPLEPFSIPFPEEGLMTELSGVLYLVNLLRSLNLPACFASTWRLSEQINCWGLLESIARGLLDNADPGLSSDPLWSALAGLAGREPDQVLGAGFTEADRYDLPAAWLNQWPGAATDQFAYCPRADHLYLWSRAGFVVARHDAGPSLEAQAREILDHYFEDSERFSLDAQLADEIPIESQTGSFAANISSGLREWLALALPYIRRRLARVLAIESDQVAAVLLIGRGRLYITITHIDLILPLSSATIAIRRAGLDFNPGWVPDLGRIVQFHFD